MNRARWAVVILIMDLGVFMIICNFLSGETIIPRYQYYAFKVVLKYNVLYNVSGYQDQHHLNKYLMK